MVAMSVTKSATLSFAKEDGVASITLHRPEVLNAYSVQMRDDLAQVLSWLRVDPDVRACVFAGEGRAFCAGADLTEFGTAPSVAIARRVRWERDVFGELRALRQPTIAALHGYAIGSGLELALCCDLRVATADTQMAFPETRLGFIPAAGGTQLLRRAGRLDVTNPAVLAGERISVEDALRAGLINRVLPDREALLDAAYELARSLAELPARAVQQGKHALRIAAEVPLSVGLAQAALLRDELLWQDGPA